MQFVQQAVGWTSESAVHRIPRRRWWTTLRLSTLRRRVAGSMTKADNDNDCDNDNDNDNDYDNDNEPVSDSICSAY